MTDVSYLRSLNRNADNPETILEILLWLHREFLRWPRSALILVLNSILILIL